MSLPKKFLAPLCIATFTIALTGCSGSSATSTQEVCNAYYDAAGPWLDNTDLEALIADPATVTSMTNAIADAVSGNAGFEELAVSSRMVANTAVNPSTATDTERAAYIEALEDWALQTEMISVTCR